MNLLWDQLAAKAGLQLQPAQHALLERFLELLYQANRTMNLTRIRPGPSARVLHVGDALSLLPLLPGEAHRLADVGSGGGLPGIPLAIVRPDAHVTLIEATRKKAAFLDRTVAALRLSNVQILQQRAEAAAERLGEAFDVAVARALAPMPVLVEWCLPLVKCGGKLLAMKGPKAQAELPAARDVLERMGGGDVRMHRVELPGVAGRVVVEIAK